MMKRPDYSRPKAKPAICPKSVLRTLLFAFMAATAQPSAAEDDPAVPDNIAPHRAPVQPLPFGHKTHLAAGLVCQTCHLNPEPGNQMTFPDIETCMACHHTIAQDQPAIRRLQEFSAAGQQIPWVRVYAITPGVNWSHRAHLNAGTQCVTCHGDVSQFDEMAETKAVSAMASCIGCHQARKAPAQCVVCHAWPTDPD